MGRPPTPILSMEGIAAAALGLIDRTGEFTMAQVAEALGVRPSSLYNHVAGKAAIVEAMRSLISQELHEESAPTGVWRDDVRHLLLRYRETFAHHPRLIPLLTSHTVASPEVMRIYDRLAELLTSAGIAPHQLVDVITVLDSLVIGGALDLAAPEQVWDRTQASNPHLVAAIDSAGSGRRRADRAFELGLDLILDGIDGLRSAER